MDSVERMGRDSANDSEERSRGALFGGAEGEGAGLGGLGLGAVRVVAVEEKGLKEYGSDG